jgi:uncharacterized membrane protein YhhN
MAPEVLDFALVFLLAASATACIEFHYRKHQRLVWLTKPLTMVFAIALAAQPSATSSDLFQGLLLAGLLCSLAGDVFLMLPSDRFIAGLASFFVGHVCYVAAFAIDAGLMTSLGREPTVLLLFLAVSAAMYAYLWPGLHDMKIPVAVYVLAIAAMGWQATARWIGAGLSGVTELGALLACIGAVFFLVSDSVLAVNRFRRPFAAAQAVVLGTYFLAQCLIALSVGSGAALAAVLAQQ